MTDMLSQNIHLDLVARAQSGWPFARQGLFFFQTRGMELRGAERVLLLKESLFN